MFSFKPTVQRKVFFAILALTAATLALLVATTQWNLSQGFGRYLAESELQRFDGLVKRLGDEYQRNGGWDRLAADPAAWRRLLEESRPDERDGPGEPRGGPPRPDGHFHDRPPPGGGHFPPGKRLILLDAQGKRVAGGNNQRGAGVARPILVDGRPVGRLSMEIPPAPGGAQATDFLIRQNSALWLAGGGGVVARVHRRLVAVALFSCPDSPARRGGAANREWTLRSAHHVAPGR